MMKISTLVLLALLFAAPSQSNAQAQQPFIFKLYGGLFFPGNDQFHDLYKSNSEKIWGAGVSIPLGGFVFLDGDIGFFRPSASIGTQIDSSVSLEENIIHVGLLHKQQIGRVLFIRTSAGVNYATIKQRYESPRSPGQEVEADKKLGYFAGIGAEQIMESGQASLYSDLLYDYRRSHRNELEGDFGGLRLVIGIHIFLF
jgi:hypothetical protein